MNISNPRIEHDLLGEREVPGDAYYGIHTLRAIENFPITGQPISTLPELIVALAWSQAAGVCAGLAQIWYVST